MHRVQKEGLASGHELSHNFGRAFEENKDYGLNKGVDIKVNSVLAL